MLIQISDITVSPERCAAEPKTVKGLADSISKVGLLNPITVDQDYTLIAGLHRLEAAKLLSWTESECIVSSLEGLAAELAKIDENFVRKDLSDIEHGELHSVIGGPILWSEPFPMPRTCRRPRRLPTSGMYPWTKVFPKRNALPNFFGKSKIPTVSSAASSLFGRGTPKTA